MAKKTDTQKIRQLVKGSIRKRRIDAGAFDGRFAPKVIQDKKKKANKNACRKNK